jgi:hypothetical protein
MTTDELTYALERLASIGQASKTKLPLRLGGFVPTVSNLGLLRKTSVSTTGTQVTLTWLEPEDYREFVANFRIHLIDPINDTPVIVAEPTRSPCRVIIPANGTARKVTFTVQTALTNGQLSELSQSPSRSLLIQ